MAELPELLSRLRLFLDFHESEPSKQDLIDNDLLFIYCLETFSNCLKIEFRIKQDTRRCYQTFVGDEDLLSTSDTLLGNANQDLSFTFRSKSCYFSRNSFCFEDNSFYLSNYYTSILSREFATIILLVWTVKVAYYIVDGSRSCIQ